MTKRLHGQGEIGEGPISGARRGVEPSVELPELPVLVTTPPKGSDWLSETKYDGYRLFAIKRDPSVILRSRGGLDWSARFPPVEQALAATELDAIYDGEVVVLREDGVSSFSELQRVLAGELDRPFVFYIFDLLYLNGWDLTPCRLEDRKAVLEKLPIWREPLRFGGHLTGDPADNLRRACAKKEEGIVCKKRDAPYRPGHNHAWLKIKCQGREEFVVLGWTDPAGSRVGLGALHVGFYAPDGQLHYAGGVGTGFTEVELERLRAALDRLTTARPPAFLYAGEPPDRHIHWVRPELVVEVRYDAWSGFGRLRHSVFLGVRQDKTADDVIREVPDVDVRRVRFGS